MKRNEGVHVSTAMAIGVPAALALPAIETVLKEFSAHPGAASLALNIRELHVPFEAMLCVPVEAHVSPGIGRNEWRLEIHAASNAQLYPRFEGVLALRRAAAGSEVALSGSYVVPLGAVGRVVDLTVFRGAAESSLRRFVRDLGHRVAALSHWTQFA